MGTDGSIWPQGSDATDPRPHYVPNTGRKSQKSTCLYALFCNFPFDRIIPGSPGCLDPFKPSSRQSWSRFPTRHPSDVWIHKWQNLFEKHMVRCAQAIFTHAAFNRCTKQGFSNLPFEVVKRKTFYLRQLCLQQFELFCCESKKQSFLF